ncbi:aspartate aminotransferase family protein [Curvivirga sp.]|uniref:aspartate aminotransferase family protein n=1 Tax=Curvivirga sp. TaxID=2856848 RepID=UPI003B5B3A3A
MSNVGNSPESRDIAYVMHPYTNQEKHKEIGPMIAEKGEGVWITDTNGNKYIEGMAGLWSTSLGFNEQRLVDAATKQMQELPYYHLFAHKTTNPAIELAERLVKMAPVPMAQAFFCNSGSEATDTVVKMVWYYNNAKGRKDKKKIIARTKGYHGVTVAAASMTGLPYNHLDFDLPIANIMHTDCPHYYRFGEEGESEEDFATRMADSLEKKILDEGPETVAAFIAEPVMGAGGVILPPKTYFEKVQAVLKKYDVLFIADEVICGFARTGNMFGSETFDLKPDMMTVAKALSSSYLPISAVIVNEDVASTISANSGKIGTFGHGYTYSGHPVSAAVAVETLKIYEERDILGHVRSVAHHLQDGLRKFADHPLVGEVRGTGLIAAVELVANKETKENFDPKMAVGPYLVGRAQEHGAILRAMGGDGVAFSPPLIITGEELDMLVERFGKALDDTANWLRETGQWNG